MSYRVRHLRSYTSVYFDEFFTKDEVDIYILPLLRISGGGRSFLYRLRYVRSYTSVYFDGFFTKDEVDI